MADVQSYLAERAAFIKNDRSLRRDRPFYASATDEEKKAESIVRAIRQSEYATVWDVDHEGIPNVFPGMEFLTARDLIMKTKLFQLLVKMPKGALLHCHLDGTVNTRFLLDLALRHPAIHVRIPTGRLTATTMQDVLPQFRALPAAEFTSGGSLTSESYSPDTWVSLQAARQSFSPALGGPQGFDKWVIDSMMISPAEAYRTHNSVKKIWQKFQSTFITSTGLIRYEPIWRDYIREFLRSSIEDGISYVEARINFWYKCMIGIDGEEDVPHRRMIQIFDEAVKDVKAEMAQQGRSDEFIGARIIYSTLRFITPEELEVDLKNVIELKKEFPHLIAGFDLVGDENALRPLIDYIEPLLKFKELQKAAGVDIPFIFHAGETLGDGHPADDNLFDAILLGTKRIGHGFSLAKHPQLVQICKERGIAVEVCPISNEILRLTSSMPAHPLPVLINNGVPVALCSDDPSVFGNMGLSFDYFQVLVASEVSGLLTMGQLARQSIESSTLEGEEQEKALAAWERRWKAFVREIANDVSLHGTLLQ